MTKIIFISDTHGQHRQLTMPPGEILVHCGDFSNMGTEKELINFAAWLKDLPYQDIFIGAGNHDLMTQDDFAQAKELIEVRPGIRLMVNEALDFAGYKWWFNPWTTEFAKWGWMKEEVDLVAEFAKIPDDTQILITHGPPHMILDTVSRQPGHHAGSKALLSRIQELKDLKYSIHGHLHNTAGQTILINGVQHINAAVLTDSNLLQINQPKVWDI